MARRRTSGNRRQGGGLGQILYWVAFALLVVVGVKAPGWFKYVGWVLAAFFVLRSIVGGRR